MVSLLRFTMIALVSALLWIAGGCGGGGGDIETDYPEAGDDQLDNTQATVEIEVEVEGVGALPVTVGALQEINLQGPALIRRGDPGDKDDDGRADIETEIVEMELTGTSPGLGTVIVRQDPDRESKGMVEQQEKGVDFPAPSFFEVNVEVELPDMDLKAVNETPIRMEATLTALPPGEGDGEDNVYRTADGEAVPLIVPSEQNRKIGRISDALHIPNPPPPDGGGDTPTPTSEPTEQPQPTPTPTTEPSLEQVLIDELVGCEHLAPGNSVLQKLMLLFLIGGSQSRHEAPGEPELLVLLTDESSLPSLGDLPALGEPVPLVGATVTVNATGPGLLPGQESHRAVTNASGEGRIQFGINKFGSYELTVVEVAGADGTRYQFDPASNVSETFEVGETCESPEGW